MGSIPEPSPVLLGLLEEAKRSTKVSRWKSAQESLRAILKIAKSLLRQSQDLRLRTRRRSSAGSKHESDVCCVDVLLEAGKLWNSLMCMDKATECFQLAEKFCSKPHHGSCEPELPIAPRKEVSGPSLLSSLIKKVSEKSSNNVVDVDVHVKRQVDVARSWVQTHLYLSETSKAKEVFSRLDEQVLSVQQPKGQAHSPRARRLARGLLLDLAHIMINEGKYKEAVEKLMNPAWINLDAPGRASENHDERCMEAERYSLLAYARYMTKDSETEEEEGCAHRTVGDVFNDVYRLWERLHWPLEHADIIINTLSRYAVERVERGHYGAENPLVNKLLDLNNTVWRHCGEVSFSVARNMYDISQAAEKIEKHHKSALYGEKTVAVFKSCPEHLDERTMFIGATLYLVGLNYFKDNKLDLAITNIDECIPLLEQSTPIEDSPHYLFAMKTLAQAYGDLAHALKIQCGAVEKSLIFSEKALQLKKFLTHSATKTAQAIRADSLHCKGALIEHNGNQKEADEIYTQADDMFQETVSGCTNSFEFVAYGYFLYRRKNYTKAARMLQMGYHYSSTEFPSLMFTHDEWHTLTEELQFEVQNSKKRSFDIPNRVVALYFHIMVLIRTGLSHDDVMEFVKELAELVETYDYISCGNKGKIPASKYRCSSLSLLGYTYRALGKYRDAARVFRKAHGCYPSEAARINMAKDTLKAKEVEDEEEDFYSHSDSDSSDSLDDIDL